MPMPHRQAQFMRSANGVPPVRAARLARLGQVRGPRLQAGKRLQTIAQCHGLRPGSPNLDLKRLTEGGSEAISA